MLPPITVTTPLPAAELLFESMTLVQGLSSLEEMELELLSEKADIEPEKLLGQAISVAMTLPDDSTRHFSGIVMRFGIGRPVGRFYGYRMSVRPWLWFLTRTTDCRIFQDLSVPEIVEKVFADHEGIANFEFKPYRSYRTRTYCVQYRESDFNFIARLLEEEGIYWYFQHADGEHKLVLVDDPGAHSMAEHCDALPFYAHAGQVPPDTEHISGWSFSREVQTGKVALTSYDFEKPAVKLGTDADLVRQHELADYEQFDFQGDYTLKADGQQLAHNRIDELQARHERLSGSTNAANLGVGQQFAMTRHPRDDQNAQYLCTASRILARVNGYESGQTAGEYSCSFNAIPAAQIYRAPRRTPKPFVQGPQTAVVVGPSGEEIFTDKYSRVKVQFHWDRLGKNNESSSCWVRVSTPWAGKSFGFVQIPRIGQEVVVDFLEGDPDQPIITGRVYNAEQMPPWELPANATQSGLLTRSSKGGVVSNANALRFEDKKGSEQLWIHAEKNQDIEVENDETHWVGHDRTKTVDHDETNHIKHDRTETVDNNETITIHGQRTEVVDKDETITIHMNRTEVVDKEESITIHGGRTEKVDKNENITIDGGRTETVAKDETITINGGRTETVAKEESITINGGRTETVAKNETITINGGRTESVAKEEKITIGGGRTESVAKDESVSVNGGRTVKIDKDDSLKVGKNLVIDAGDSVTIKTGSASITMKKDGTITIKGKDITIDGSGKINVKASSDVVIKGSKVLQN